VQGSCQEKDTADGAAIVVDDDLAPLSVENMGARMSWRTCDDIMKILLAGLLVLSSASAFAHNCPNEMKAIDAKIKTEPKVTAAELDKIMFLRADGEKLHKAGKHDESMKALGEAKKLLGI
jgi:hypothetical protein